MALPLAQRRVHEHGDLYGMPESSPARLYEERLVTDYDACPYKITCKEEDPVDGATPEQSNMRVSERFNVRGSMPDNDTENVCRSPRSQCMSQAAYDECVELRDAGCALINLKTIKDSCPLIFYCSVPTNK
eukprot:CAMPEP_0172504276 /NCGR_PEP_ID=MMETSP1066-20121228/177052_1 /TAXON_ID=671091 /ORGANISM="Coscinodiscus wailesii, Strain CCMP2513" /LENGTH=130 /DNA_ID=CAMNT_0013280373 /DNA_START=141 /DNA_END=534 /DNA_ORIENTATION=-